MFTVGLTGGIGSGKSTVTTLFAELGARIIDADHIAHQLGQPPSPALTQIAEQFGRAYLNAEGALDRNKMRLLVFQDPSARQRLEAIFHPLIRSRITSLLQQADQTAPYTMLAIPLLFESGQYEDIIDRSVVVDCSVEQQIVRTMARSYLRREEVEQIIATQLPRAARLAKADDIIDNSQDKHYLYAQVERLHHDYLKHNRARRD